ncbi:hypothetical protein L6452_43455 [Arctium lappa]|uniref:Uncharacterized protein n=1 Tax=Arctium lappa TaxID=4217 RepID=A0ACB8XDG1_ARCLA|nr:hypothetical protein L6452_43455 [Arctium lappa]
MSFTNEVVDSLASLTDRLHVTDNFEEDVEEVTVENQPFQRRKACTKSDMLKTLEAKRTLDHSHMLTKATKSKAMCLEDGVGTKSSSLVNNIGVTSREKNKDDGTNEE